MKLKLVDTHSHIYLPDFSHDREAILNRAVYEGINRIVLPNIDLSSVEEVIQLTAQYPDNCFPLVGLHPCSVTDSWEKDLSHLIQYLDGYKWFGIGEVGLDRFWDIKNYDNQVLALSTQIQWANEYDLPLVLHTRDAINETLDILESYKDRSLRGVLHCFTGDESQALRTIQLGFLLGIGGVISFKNSQLGATLKSLGAEVLDFIVLETDSPYLAPVPYRGKRNEPAYLTNVLHELSKALQMEPIEIAEITTYNAEKLFRFPSN
jgi:TatD DNase family protein